MLVEAGKKVYTMVDGALAARAERSILLRVARDLLGAIDEALGRPFTAPAGAPQVETAARREAAPVVVYFDGRDHRTKKRIDDLLLGAGIAYQTIDVSDDEVGRSWALTQARRRELPLVFVAGDPVGTFDDLLQAEVNGELKRRVFG